MQFIGRCNTVIASDVKQCRKTLEPRLVKSHHIGSVADKGRVGDCFFLRECGRILIIIEFQKVHGLHAALCLKSVLRVVRVLVRNGRTDEIIDGTLDKAVELYRH